MTPTATASPFFSLARPSISQEPPQNSDLELSAGGEVAAIRGHQRILLPDHSCGIGIIDEINRKPSAASSLLIVFMASIMVLAARSFSS